MTTKDKTGDQLMASIRKAKTDSSAQGAESAEAPEAAAPTPPTPAAAKPEAAAAKARAKAPRVAKKRVVRKPPPARAEVSEGRNNYQSPGRVWPD